MMTLEYSNKLKDVLSSKDIILINKYRDKTFYSLDVLYNTKKFRLLIDYGMFSISDMKLDGDDSNYLSITDLDGFLGMFIREQKFKILDEQK